MRRALTIGMLLVIALAIIVTAWSAYQGSLVISQLIEIVKDMGYPGAFAAGFLGSSSLFIAIFPSYFVVAWLGTFLNPVFVGILAGLGAGIGQYLHYYIGMGGRYALSEKRRESLAKWRRRLERYGLWLVLLFAMTPATPDDLIWIPLGLVGYPKMRALVAAITGKIILNTFYAYAGLYGWPIIEDLLSSFLP